MTGTIPQPTNGKLEKLAGAFEDAFPRIPFNGAVDLLSIINSMQPQFDPTIVPREAKIFVAENPEGYQLYRLTAPGTGIHYIIQPPV